MQYNLFFFCVYSSLFILELVMKLFDNFWKTNSPFSKFCVICPSRFYFKFCKIVL